MSTAVTAHGGRRSLWRTAVASILVYASLVAGIVAVYATVVAGGGILLGRGDEPSIMLAYAATALVAVGFQPARSRLRRFANRLLYGRTSTPYQVLSDFARRITGTDEQMLDEVARWLVEGTSGSAAAVWVVSGDRLVPVARWPADSEHFAPMALGALETATGDALLRSVRHGGETLGALSLVPASGKPITPPDEKLLDQLASGMGLALRNIRLGRDLEDHVEELRRSRDRLVVVADETRRRLERELHEGAQQQLVALKVRLALVRAQAESDGLDDVADALTHLASEADAAVQALRDFARGVYPPLLEAEGLDAALSAQARRLQVPVTVHATGLGRMGRDVEAAVYFAILEALQNTAKHAGASSARVTLSESDGGLDFEVSDDGGGFDAGSASRGSGLSNITDRINAIGGSVEIRSIPGQGTVVRGRVPVRREAGE